MLYLSCRSSNVPDTSQADSGIVGVLATAGVEADVVVAHQEEQEDEGAVEHHEVVGVAEQEEAQKP